MYKQQCKKRKSPAAVLLLTAFLLAFCLSVMLNSVLAFAGIDSSKVGRLFTGENITVSSVITENGTLVSANGAGKATANYNATLAMDYARTLTSWTPDDPADENSTGTVDFLTAGAREHFNLRFSVDALMSDTIVFEFTDYTNTKNAIRITFDFSDFKAGANEGDPSTFEITITVAHTTDGWKNKDERDTVISAAADWNDPTNNNVNYFTGDNAQYRHTILQGIVFELDLDFANGFTFKRFKNVAQAEGTPPTQAYFNAKVLWTPVSLYNMRFINDTAKMSVRYEDPRTASGTEEQNVFTGLLFREINGQTLGNGNDGRKDALPVIMPDKKVDNLKVLEAPDFGLAVNNYAGYNGLQTALKANVVFPIVVADAANFSMCGYYEVWELDPANGFALKGETPVGTKDFSWNSSGISYYFEKEGFYEVRVFVGNFSSGLQVENAVKQTDTTADNYQKVVAQRLIYRVVKDTSAPVLKDATGKDLQDYVNAEFNNTKWQNLPAYQKDFTFPRPDGLFTNDIGEEDYTFSFSIGYKFESDASYQWSDSLSLRITKTGMLKFKYVVKASSGKKNTDTKEYFYDENYPEFELIFSDNLAPEIELSTSQKIQTIDKDSKFSAPAPTVTDNSTEGGYVIAAETRVWHAYAGWTASNGLYKDGISKLTEVEFDEDGKIKMDKAGVYYFVVFYQAEDTHNNRTAAFPEDAEVQKDVSDEKWSKSFWLIKVTVEDPDKDNTNSTLLIILIVLGTLSLVGFITLLFIKPIDEVKWKARRDKIK